MYDSLPKTKLRAHSLISVGSNFVARTIVAGFSTTCFSFGWRSKVFDVWMDAE